MRFESTLVSSWSRREWLSVAVVAVTTAFLIGSTVLLLTVGSYTTTLEDDLGSSASATYYESYESAVAEADQNDVVFALTQVTVEGDGTHRVIGVPPDAPQQIESAAVAWEQATVPQPPEEGLRGPVSRPTRLRISDDTVPVSPRRTSTALFSQRWYVGSVETVVELDETHALVIDPGSETATPQWQQKGVPLIAALPFLLGGISQVLQALSLAALGGGLLVLVVVYNVTRMSIRDRHREIRVARATGISPRRLFVVLETRVGLLTTTGVLLGFSLGVIATNAVINAATYAGLPVTLRTVVTPSVFRAVLALGGFLFGMGLVAGVLASLPVVRGDPSSVGRSRHRTDGADEWRGFLPPVLQPTFVDWRTLIPTATTLSVFVLVVLLTAGIGGAIAPLATTSSGTIVENGSPHPLNSRISEDYADVLRAQNITASPEVIYAQTLDGRPYLVRGANYSAFSDVSDATLIQGHAPQAADQAVIGASLAQTLDVDVGDTVTIGGSVSPGVRRVTVVGRFSGTGITDDQLVVPTDTTQGLATKEGTVHIIRTSGATGEFEQFARQSRGLVVTDLSGPSETRAGSNYTVVVHARNLGTQRATADITAHVGNQTRTRAIAAESGETVESTFTFRLRDPGTYTVSVGGLTKSLQVYDGRTLTLPPEYPDRAPPGATLIVPAITPDETPVTDATVALGDRQARTDERGAVPMRVPTEPGAYTITVSKANYTTARHTLVVERGAPRPLTGRLSVSPSTGTRVTDPTVTIQLANPWGRFVARNVSLSTPATTRSRTVEMPAGNVTEFTISAAEAGFDQTVAPGSYDLRLVSNGNVITTTTYRVTGDERVAATLASQGEYSRGTGIGRAIENVFGNVQVLFLVMIVLAGLSTVGGTTATFAHAVHANRRTIGIYRATGGSRRRIVGLLLADAVRVAVPATAISFTLSLGMLYSLAWADLLVVFGVRLSIPLSPFTVISVGLGAVTLAAVSALGVGLAVLRTEPSRLFSR